MTDETENVPTGERVSSDDPRFEVKWKKKNSSSPPSAPSEPAAAEANESSESLQKRLEESEEQVKNLRDRWQRAAADLANLRRRTEQERGDTERFASMLLVAELLPVLDNFERALATVPGNLQMLTWVQGVALIERHLRAVLENQGLAPIEAKDQMFNPQLHEAVAERPSSDVAPGTIVSEYQRGYTMHGRVIRPSLVEVASHAPVSADTTEAEGESIAEQAATENVGP